MQGPSLCGRQSLGNHVTAAKIPIFHLKESNAFVWYGHYLWSGALHQQESAVGRPLLSVIYLLFTWSGFVTGPWKYYPVEFWSSHRVRKAAIGIIPQIRAGLYSESWECCLGWGGSSQPAPAVWGCRWALPLPGDISTGTQLSQVAEFSCLAPLFLPQQSQCPRTADTGAALVYKNSQ